jgi:serine phosphatase RsbU (regulator of sigma subunit)
MSTATHELPITFEPISGPDLGAITMRDPANILGRGGKSNHVLPHDGVSREHVSITCHGGTWYAADLASRNGTRLGSLPLPIGQPTPLRDGDTLEIKPWVFLVRIGRHASRSAARTVDDGSPTTTRVRGDTESPAEPRIRQQFESLLRASALLHSARDEKELLDYLLQTALGATGFERAAVIRRTETIESVEIVAQRFRGDKAPPPGTQFHFSRSLLRAAASGPHAAVADPSAMTPRPETMVRLDIAAAACAPIRLNEAVWGYLYLDSGSGTPPTSTGDLLDLVRSLADIASLALSNVMQREVRKRLETLQDDFEAAAEIQKFLLPVSPGSIGGLAFAVTSSPGRIVTGDFFDVIAMDRGRVAVFLGDVQGKGLAAGLLMCSVQSHLQALLSQNDDPGAVLELMNSYLVRRIGIGRIVSLWLGVFDPARGVATVSDAGHGYCVRTGPDGSPTHLRCAGGTPLGSCEEASYVAATIPARARDRFILFSDGVVEQPSPRGEVFGLQRLLSLVEGDHPPASLVDRIVHEVRAHAESTVPADDMTAAVIEVVQ